MMSIFFYSMMEQREESTFADLHPGRRADRASRAARPATRRAGRRGPGGGRRRPPGPPGTRGPRARDVVHQAVAGHHAEAGGLAGPCGVTSRRSPWIPVPSPIAAPGSRSGVLWWRGVAISLEIAGGRTWTRATDLLQPGPLLRSPSRIRHATRLPDHGEPGAVGVHDMAAGPGQLPGAWPAAVGCARERPAVRRPRPGGHAAEIASGSGATSTVGLLRSSTRTTTMRLSGYAWEQVRGASTQPAPS